MWKFWTIFWMKSRPLPQTYIQYCNYIRSCWNLESGILQSRNVFFIIIFWLPKLNARLPCRVSQMKTLFKICFTFNLMFLTSHILATRPTNDINRKRKYNAHSYIFLLYILSYTLRRCTVMRYAKYSHPFLSKHLLTAKRHTRIVPPL